MTTATDYDNKEKQNTHRGNTSTDRHWDKNRGGSSKIWFGQKGLVAGTKTTLMVLPVFEHIIYYIKHHFETRLVAIEMTI